MVWILFNLKTVVIIIVNIVLEFPLILFNGLVYTCTSHLLIDIMTCVLCPCDILLLFVLLVLAYCVSLSFQCRIGKFYSLNCSMGGVICAASSYKSIIVAG